MLHNLARAAAIAAFVAGTLLAPVPAQAGGERSANVRYSDLNLASATGKAMLERRVASAADRVCGVANEQMPRLIAAARRCAATARESARPAIELAYRNAANGQLAARDMSVTVAP
ncbi:UrcA family protein [Sphingomonas sp. MG17]|uniref:UrcA family protein n=1 Tax=Sphingomonas tagetis TaxID=2949092 RepID=A0A9X2HNY2_9SPHN|nr:UrcA family protein [Sphingomonas tagetis]MCP3729845.1 UrcA family protein [Sphingomonas tagetis]